MNVAIINPIHSSFKSHYVNLELDTLIRNVSQLLTELKQFWPIDLEMVEYHYCTKDGQYDKTIKSKNFLESFHNVPKNCQALTLTFKHIEKADFGFDLSADEYIRVSVLFSDNLIEICQCVLGDDKAKKVIEILTEGIALIKTTLPKNHQYISSSLKLFHQDHPNPDKNVFVIMRFQNETPFPEILGAIEKSCIDHGLNPVRADQKSYTDDIWDNVLTYMYGCNFAIAVFDQINYREFNPNVALEVGFMLSQTKRILLLKDQAIPALPTDIVGKIYRPFNAHEILKTIPPQLEKWFNDCSI
ncbi:MAG: hypothetical protein WCS87_12055 [Methylococcaceae bacterium]